MAKSYQDRLKELQQKTKGVTYESPVERLVNSTITSGIKNGTIRGNMSPLTRLDRAVVESQNKPTNVLESESFKATKLADTAAKNLSDITAKGKEWTLIGAPQKTTNVDIPNILVNKGTGRDTLTNTQKLLEQQKQKASIVATPEYKQELNTARKQADETATEAALSQYILNNRIVDERDINLVDKTIGRVANAVGSFGINQYMYTDEKGTSFRLPNQSEILDAKVQQSYSDTAIGKIGKTLGDVAFGGTKIAVSTLINTASAAVGIPVPVGSIMYFGDMFSDNYNQQLKNGYTEEQAVLNSTLKTGLEFITGKILGSATKGLTGGNTSELEKAIADNVNKLTSNKAIVKYISGLGSEGLEEFIQSYCEKFIDLASLEREKNPEKYLEVILNGENFKEALYEGIVGGLTGGVFAEFDNSIDVLDKNNIKKQDMVIKTLFDEKVAEAKQSGKKLTSKELRELESQIKSDLNAGIDISKIEEILLSKEDAEIRKQAQDMETKLKNNEISQQEFDKFVSDNKESLNKTLELSKQLTQDNNLLKQSYLENYNKGITYQPSQDASVRQQKIEQDLIKLNKSNSMQNRELARNYTALSETLDFNGRLIDTNSVEYKEHIKDIKNDISKRLEKTDKDFKAASEMVKQELVNSEYDRLYADSQFGGWVDSKTGEMYINLDSKEAVNFILGHETGHIIKGTKSYNKLIESLNKYAESKGTLQEMKNSIINRYGTLDVEELNSDLIGKYVFNDQEFINSLAIDDRTTFNKIYDFINRMVDKITGNNSESAKMRDIQSKFRKALKESNKGITTSKNALLRYNKIDNVFKEQDKRVSEAYKMQNKGYNEDFIWAMTGVKFIDNTDALIYVKDLSFKNNIDLINLKPGKYKLNDIMEGPLLNNIDLLNKLNFKLIDFEQDTLNDTGNKEFAKEMGNIAGGASIEEGILINKGYIDKIKNKFNSQKVIENIISHEVQHIIQEIEYGKTSSTAFFNYDEKNNKIVYIGPSAEESEYIYRNNPKEIESEVTRVQNEMTPSEKKILPLNLLFDEIKTYYENKNTKSALNPRRFINNLFNKYAPDLEKWYNEVKTGDLNGFRKYSYGNSDNIREQESASLYNNNDKHKTIYETTKSAKKDADLFIGESTINNKGDSGLSNETTIEDETNQTLKENQQFKNFIEDENKISEKGFTGKNMDIVKSDINDLTTKLDDLTNYIKQTQTPQNIDEMPIRKDINNRENAANEFQDALMQDEGYLKSLDNDAELTFDKVFDRNAYNFSDWQLAQMIGRNDAPTVDTTQYFTNTSKTNFLNNRDIAPVQQTNNIDKQVQKNKAINTLQQAFVNQNAVIDSFAKQIGNNNIKFAGDMLNNVSAEANTNINGKQTDINGKVIGKGVKEIFKPSKDAGLYPAFNDYLIQKSNLERTKMGKGSLLPYEISQDLVNKYESENPIFKTWAKDVYKYYDNVLNEQVKAGLITDDQYKFFRGEGGIYKSYVPFYPGEINQDRYFDNEGKLKAVSTLKRAKGGADQILNVEDSMAKQTYAYKSAIRQNMLNQEIVQSIGGSDIDPFGLDARGENVYDLSKSMYQDSDGKYHLAAYFDGKQVQAEISEDMYRELSKTNPIQQGISEAEKNFSGVLKPLQKVSNFRRNLLTSWNPTFVVTNAIKDIQDATINSKHTAQMLKNYPGSFVELAKANTTEVQQFLALYGNENLLGKYDEKSNWLTKANEIVELAPRFAEFKASLQAGESIQEAMYNAREVTTNFGRGGYITKALNRNGFTFLNASVQGFDKMIRNLTGQNGVKGVSSVMIKGAIFAVLPAILNELAFGVGDDKDEEYEALPNYIKDNYYLIKLEDGQFLRIPKGRMISVIGSAARRGLETIETGENQFEGYVDNAWSQVGIGDLGSNNIFAPINQAFGSENGTAWYGGDIVPTRLQNLPAGEQTDSTIDDFSTWLGEKLNISPYKINYVLDQYSGGIGDIALPMITPATKNGASGLGYLTAPISDKFVVNSIDDNKYSGEFYKLKDNLQKASNSIHATDEDILKYKYMSNISSEMSELYKEKREVQSDTTIDNQEKYKRVQSIQEQINEFARTALKDYQKGFATENYSKYGDYEYYKNTKDEWTKINDSDLEFVSGMTESEKDSYFKVKNSISIISENYKDNIEGYDSKNKNDKKIIDSYAEQKKQEIIKAISNTNLDDYEKGQFYAKYYSTEETMANAINSGFTFESYVNSINGIENVRNKYSQEKGYTTAQRKQQVVSYVNKQKLSVAQKAMLIKKYYSSFDDYNSYIVNYVSSLNISKKDKYSILSEYKFKIDANGKVSW